MQLGHQGKKDDGKQTGYKQSHGAPSQQTKAHTAEARSATRYGANAMPRDRAHGPAAQGLL